MTQCKFQVAWRGQCKNEAVEGSEFCEAHLGMKCVSCGAPATRTCDATRDLVCGAPLCDDCDHCTFPDGTNGGIGFGAQPVPADLPQCRHCKSTEQKYKPWYLRENDE